MQRTSDDPGRKCPHAVPVSAADGGTVGAIYTCPMHPEIQQPQPGSCPKCGMSLEPLVPALEDAQDPELRDFSRRFWWTLPFTVVVAFLAMTGHRMAWFAG